MRPHGKAWSWLAWALGTLVAASAWWRWRVMAPIEHEKLTIINYDLYHEVVPRLEFAYQAVRNGVLPLWNPYQLSGTPFLATQQHGLLYPLNLPHLFLSLPAALTTVAILHYAIAALSTGALARSLGLSTGAAIVAAVSYAASGSMFLRLYLPPHLYAAAWLPLQLLLVRRLCTTGVTARRIAALSIVCAFQFLGGYGQYCVLAGYLMLAYAVCAVATGDRRAALRGGAGLLLAVILSLALSAIQLLPAFELLLQSPRHPGVLGAAQLRGEGVLETARIILLDWPIPGFPREGGLGVVVILLALAGVLARRSVADRRFLLGAVAASLFLAMGALAPGFTLLSHLPGYGWFRQPARAVVIAVLGIALLAAAGFDRLARSRTRRQAWAALWPAMFILAALAAVLAYRDRTLIAWAPWHGFLWLAPVAAVLLVAPRNGARAAAVCLIAVAEMAVLNRNTLVIPQQNPDFVRPPAGAVRFLREHQGLWRTLVRSVVHGFQPPMYPPQKTGMMAHLFTIGDYENLYPAAYNDYVALLQGYKHPRVAWQGRILGSAANIDRKLLNLASCRFILAARNQPFTAPNDPRFPLRYEDTQARVRENPAALPRAYVVSRVVPVRNPREALTRLRAADFDPASTITISGWTGPSPPPASEPGSAEVTTYEAEHVVVEARARQAAFLVLTDQFYPGWKATVDGSSAAIYRANAIFRAVFLSPGRHRVEFVYAPFSFRAGLIASVLSWVGIAIIVPRFRNPP